MTVYVELSESNIVPLYFNIPNVDDSILYTFEITSQYSHEPIVLSNALIATNARYTEIQVVFPAGFSETHKNGIYNWTLKETDSDTILQRGLMKIITEPGGSMGTVSYDSGADAENRVADVYYRPNY